MFAKICFSKTDVKQGTKLLGYHAIGEGVNGISIPASWFRKQVDWLLRQGYRILNLKTCWDHVTQTGFAPDRTVVLTFDDGYRNVLTHAARVLSDYGLTGTVFVTTNYIGKTSAFNAQFGFTHLAMLGWDEIDELVGLGWDIQSHGHYHYPLYRLAPELRDEEFVRSKAILEGHLKRPVDFYCYPFGAFDEGTVAAIRRAGYKAAVGGRPGVFHRIEACDVYRLPRLSIYSSMDLSDFKLHFSTVYDHLTHVRAKIRKWRGRDLSCSYEPQKFTKKNAKLEYA